MTATERALRAAQLYLMTRKPTPDECAEWKRLTGLDWWSGEKVAQLCDRALSEIRDGDKV